MNVTPPHRIDRASGAVSLEEVARVIEGLNEILGA